MVSFAQLGQKFRPKPDREVSIPSHQTKKLKSGHCLMKLSKVLVTTGIISSVDTFAREAAMTVSILKKLGSQNFFSVKVTSCIHGPTALSKKILFYKYISP